MDEKQKKFKRPPKKYQPRGVAILYEDRDIIVVDKVSGLMTSSADRLEENTAEFRLNNYVRKGVQKSKNRVFIVHRLDRDTSGVLIFAKTDTAKIHLLDAWTQFKRKYCVVVNGHLAEKEGIITSYLAENSIHKMYSVTDPKKGTLATTGYKVLRESKNYSLLEIDLLTGRENQIRAHFSEKGCPVAGDKRYGKKQKGVKRLALHLVSITTIHPHTKEEMTFEAKIPGSFNALFKSGPQPKP